MRPKKQDSVRQKRLDLLKGRIKPVEIMDEEEAIIYQPGEYIRPDWHAWVYGGCKNPAVDSNAKNIDYSQDLPDDWMKLRRDVIDHAHFKCLRCDRRVKKYRDLTVHHVIPRSNGGGDNIENLVALCAKCHDIVECEEMHSIAEIIGSYDPSDNYPPFTE